MILLEPPDFVDGKYNIPAASAELSATDGEVQAYIDDNEKKYIYMLLGVTLGDAIISYIAGGSSGNSDYDKIIGAFAETNTTCAFSTFRQSLGLKEYLKACIYYEYTSQSYTLTMGGTVKVNSEISDHVSASATLRKAESYFNGILDTVEAIQDVCLANPTAYAGYAGTRIAVKGHQFFI